MRGFTLVMPSTEGIGGRGRGGGGRGCTKLVRGTDGPAAESCPCASASLRSRLRRFFLAFLLSAGNTTGGLGLTVRGALAEAGRIGSAMTDGTSSGSRLRF